MGQPLQQVSYRRLSLWSYLMKVWEMKHLVWVLSSRDLKVKYAQTLLGLLWVLIQPLTGLLIFYVFFSVILSMDTGDIPYLLYTYSGLICWMFFTYVVSSAGTALMQEEALIKKVYFPRLILPLAKVVTGYFDLIISTVVLIVMALIMQHPIGIEILALPLIMLLLAVAGLSIALWLSALTIRYRDFHHLIPYIVGFGIWLTPVFYPVSLIPEKYRVVLLFNPIAGAVQWFRWSTLSGPVPDWRYIYGGLIALVLLVSGLSYFRKVERKIADFA